MTGVQTCALPIYNSRYFNWKTKLDVVNGAFTTTLKSWVSPVTASLLSGWFGFGYDEDDVNKNTKVVLNYKFFKVNYTNRINRFN